MTTTFKRPMSTSSGGILAGFSIEIPPPRKAEPSKQGWQRAVWRKLKNASSKRHIAILKNVQLPLSTGILVLEPIQNDRLKTVRFVSPASIKLIFADDLEEIVPVARFGMPVDRIRWQTARMTDNGKSMTVTAIKGELVPIASTTLRYLVDEAYAAQVSAKLSRLRASFNETDDEGEEPAGLFGHPESDPVLESWK